MSSHELRVEDLTVSYGRIPAIHHIGLSLSCGRCAALIGPNGAGKTTFLKALAGLLARESGTIYFHGRAIRGATPDLAYLPQRESLDWDFPITVRGLVEMGRYLKLGMWKRFGSADRDAVHRAITEMQLDAFAHRQISALSGGQQQRAFLARALAQEAHVLLLDEPFTGLDKPTQGSLSAILRRLTAEGKLVIASHHDTGTVPALFDDAILLNGELIASGPTAEVFTMANLDRTYGTAVFSGRSDALAY